MNECDTRHTHTHHRTQYTAHPLPERPHHIPQERAPSAPFDASTTYKVCDCVCACVCMCVSVRTHTCASPKSVHPTTTRFCALTAECSTGLHLRVDAAVCLCASAHMHLHVSALGPASKPDLDGSCEQARSVGLVVVQP